MWSFSVTPIQRLVGTLGLLTLLASCTVGPLNATSSSRVGADGTSSSVRAIMKSITVDPVNERVAQQVRNNLLFELNGGQQEPGGQYNVSLRVSPQTRSLAIEGDSLSTTSAQVAVTVNYRLIDTETNEPIAEGVRRAVASFDQTPQSFANERATRDAQNRAAKEVAQQVKLAIGQALTSNNS